MIRLYLLLFIVGTIGSVAYGGYRYVTALQQQVITLRENNLQLENAVATQQETIARQEANATRQAELNKDLNNKLVQAESGLDALRKRFTQIDINKEAIEDPEGLEVRVNNAVQKLIAKIQSDTSITVPAE
jgi:predicted Holliday junction resolvase-like endonuclease